VAVVRNYIGREGDLIEYNAIIYKQYVTLQARSNGKEIELTELDKTQKILVHCGLS
jgi:hypothetical protein